MLLTFARSLVRFWSAVLLAVPVSCAGPSRTTSSAETPPVAEDPAPLSPEAFEKATQTDLTDTDELKGRLPATDVVEFEHIDTFSTQPVLSASEFASATLTSLPDEPDLVYEAEASAAPKLFPITLRSSLVESIKNSTSIATDFQVIGASRVHKIGAGGDDGDIHIGGIAEDIGLPCVVEVMNAKGNPAVDRAKELADDQQTVRAVGAWRLWCEHPGVAQVQFDTRFRGPPSNPDHVLEIHPATKFDALNLTSTFQPIPNYTAYDARKAFTYYESVPCKLEVDDDQETITIRTPQARYNYAEFRIKIEDDAPLITSDGRFLRCTVLDDQGGTVASNRRMVFVKGTPPEKQARSLQKGNIMRVLGIPRMNLAVFSWRARQARTRPEVLTWRLPYEMIIVAVINNG